MRRDYSRPCCRGSAAALLLSAPTSSALENAAMRIYGAHATSGCCDLVKHGEQGRVNPTAGCRTWKEECKCLWPPPSLCI